MKVHLRRDSTRTVCGIKLFVPVKTANAKQYIVVESFTNVLDNQKCSKCLIKVREVNNVKM